MESSGKENRGKQTRGPEMRDEWDDLKSRARDCWVLETLWRAENGKPIDIHDNHNEETGDIFPEYIPSGKPWKTHEIDAVNVPFFTTDRNACALVLDEIGNRGEKTLALFDKALVSAIWGEGAEGYPTLISALSTDPDTICYAAVVAFKEARDADD